jgi:hypothetical protein
MFKRLLMLGALSCALSMAAVSVEAAPTTAAGTMPSGVQNDNATAQNPTGVAIVTGTGGCGVVGFNGGCPLPVTISGGSGSIGTTTTPDIVGGAANTPFDQGSGASDANTLRAILSTDSLQGYATATLQGTINTSVQTLHTDNGTDATGVSQPSGGAGSRGWLSGLYNLFANVGAKVTGTFWPYTLNGDGGVPSHVTNFPATQVVSGSVTATSTSTSPDASGIPSTEVNGNITSLSTTTETSLIAAQGAGKRIVLDYVSIYNPDTSDHVYAIRTVLAGSVRAWATIPAGTASPVFLPPAGLNALAANTAVTVQIVDANAIGTASQITAHGFTTTQ